MLKKHFSYFHIFLPPENEVVARYLQNISSSRILWPSLHWSTNVDFNSFWDVGLGELVGVNVA